MGCRAVTSAGSSELIAVSSLCTYDIYRTYINPKANGKQILWVSRLAVLCFGCFMGVLAIVLNKAGVSLGWMYLAMGVFIGSAVMPVAFLLLWSKANAKGAMLAPSSVCSPASPPGSPSPRYPSPYLLTVTSCDAVSEGDSYCDRILTLLMRHCYR